MDGLTRLIEWLDAEEAQMLRLEWEAEERYQYSAALSWHIQRQHYHIVADKARELREEPAQIRVGERT